MNELNIKDLIMLIIMGALVLKFIIWDEK